MKESDNCAHKQKTMGITACISVVVMLISLAACGEQIKLTAPAVNSQDSIAFMRAKGVHTLISDSGLLRYKIIAEEWDIFNQTSPPKWTFIKGIYLERFDETFHVEWYLQSDTAYCYNQNLWEFRGRVQIRNLEGTQFRTEELFWDMTKRELYSTLFMRVITPERELQGYNFRSNEEMTNYEIYNSKAALPFEEAQETIAPEDSVTRMQPTKIR